MTLDASEPTDQRMVSELAEYIRANRTAINLLSAGAVVSTTLTVTAASTSLSVGTDLSSSSIEVIVISGSGISTIETILGGTAGQIKIFIFQDANVRIEDGNVKNSGKFFLNQLPSLNIMYPSSDDVLVVANVGGDGSSTPGYWKELYRTLSVK